MSYEQEQHYLAITLVMKDKRKGFNEDFALLREMIDIVNADKHEIGYIGYEVQESNSTHEPHIHTYIRMNKNFFNYNKFYKYWKSFNINFKTELLPTKEDLQRWIRYIHKEKNIIEKYLHTDSIPKKNMFNNVIR